jgi:hypothetical protein
MLKATPAKSFSAFNGTSLQGYVNADFKVLKKLFGKPTDGDGYKVDAEWLVTFNDGVVATIYNYKDGKNYNGSRGTPKTQITEWHVGGRSARAVANVEAMLDMYYAQQEAMTA